MVLMDFPCPQVPPGAAEEAPGPRGTVKQQGSTDGNLHRGVWSPRPHHGLLASREGGREGGRLRPTERFSQWWTEGQTEGGTCAKAEGWMLQGWMDGRRDGDVRGWMEGRV